MDPRFRYLGQSLLRIKIPLLRSVHWLMHRSFNKMGFQWELRRKGELKIGLWRQSFRAKDPVKRTYPRRFVLIPGFGDTPLSWYPVVALMMPILKRNFDEIILMDFPGFSGFLAREKCIHSMDALREMVADVLDELKVHTIVGHSLGGWLTAYYAGVCGEGTRPSGNKHTYAGPEKIILADPSGVFGDIASKKRWEEIFRLSMEEGFHHLRPFIFFKEPVWFKHVQSEFAAFILKEDVRTFAQSVRDDHSVEKLLPKIRAKVWLLWGEKDELCPTEWVNTWLRLFSISPACAQAVIIKNVGHSIQIEAPAKTASVLAQILQSKTPHPLGRRWYKVLSGPTIKALPTP